MPRPTIDYLNARRALKPASGGKVYSRKVKYAEDENIRVLQRLNDNGLKTAIESVGGVRALADLLGLNCRSVYRWRHVPTEQIIQIEKVTGVPRDVLRPDLGWAEDTGEYWIIAATRRWRRRVEAKKLI
jgi:DNA-binding transcriptional regulator YdaS (Cro superfamily)